MCPPAPVTRARGGATRAPALKEAKTLALISLFLQTSRRSLQCLELLTPLSISLAFADQQQPASHHDRVHGFDLRCLLRSSFSHIFSILFSIFLVDLIIRRIIRVFSCGSVSARLLSSLARLSRCSCAVFGTKTYCGEGIWRIWKDEVLSFGVFVRVTLCLSEAILSMPIVLVRLPCPCLLCYLWLLCVWI